jgi:AcrR family transcriptional regulator
MPRSEAQNEVIRDKRRKKILDKSLFLFAIQGFDDITVDDITIADSDVEGKVELKYSIKLE